MFFAEMSVCGLLFHPQDDPEEIMRSDTWERCFTDTQAAEVHEIIGLMFAEQGGETISACHPVFMHAADQRLDA